jgi:hypothetical protein
MPRIESIGISEKMPASHEATGAKAATLKACPKFFWPSNDGASASITCASTKTIARDTA